MTGKEPVDVYKRQAEDVAGLKDKIDGCIVGTHFIELMEENNYDLDVAKEYILSLIHI